MEIKINDVYRFRYNPEHVKKLHSPYHCFDGLLKVRQSDKGLILVDGYWSSDNKWFTLGDALKQGELEFICNLDEVEQINKYESKYYNEKDIFILPYHSGYHTMYLKRKGAEKCRETIMKQLEAKIQKAKSDLESAKRSLEWAEKDYERALKEEDINKIYL